ncbi:MAG: hypothetical protein AAGF85_20350 [Bacteroidota bacterium]
MNRGLTILVFVFAPLVGLAQNEELQKSYQQYQQGQVAEAKEIIDAVYKQYADLNDPNALYLKGFIYKDFYKANREKDSTMVIRNESIRVFDQLLSLSPDDKIKQDAKSSLNFLYNTYYNDAIDYLNQERFDLSGKHFDRYCELIGDDVNKVQQLKKEYLLSKAFKYSSLHKQDSVLNQSHWSGAIDTYKEVLKIDSADTKANYNIGVLLYNKAVNLISSLEYGEIDIISISQIEEQSLDLFKEALPYMLSVFNKKPDDQGAIKGLAGIYFSLRDFETSDRYRAMLDD